jgi:hypothetical protein
MTIVVNGEFCKSLVFMNGSEPMIYSPSPPIGGEGIKKEAG